MGRLIQYEQLLARDWLAVPDRPDGLRVYLALLVPELAVFVALPAIFEIAEQQLQRAEIAMPFHKLGVQSQRALEIGHGLAEAAQLLHSQAAPGKRGRAGWVSFKSGVEIEKRAFRPRVLELDNAPAKQSLHGARILRQRLVEHRRGFGKPPDLA